jgi:hypothetical protein
VGVSWVPTHGTRTVTHWQSRSRNSRSSTYRRGAGLVALHTRCRRSSKRSAAGACASKGARHGGPFLRHSRHLPLQPGGGRRGHIIPWPGDPLWGPCPLLRQLRRAAAGLHNWGQVKFVLYLNYDDQQVIFEKAGDFETVLPHDGGGIRFGDPRRRSGSSSCRPTRRRRAWSSSRGGRKSYSCRRRMVCADCRPAMWQQAGRGVWCMDVLGDSLPADSRRPSQAD